MKRCLGSHHLDTKKHADETRIICLIEPEIKLEGITKNRLGGPVWLGLRTGKRKYNAKKYLMMVLGCHLSRPKRKQRHMRKKMNIANIDNFKFQKKLFQKF